MWTKSRTDSADPSRWAPYTERLEPSLIKLRREIVEPTLR
jgi:hypothetical protein